MIYFDYLLEGSKVLQVNKMDGEKLLLPDGGWFFYSFLRHQTHRPLLW